MRPKSTFSTKQDICFFIMRIFADSPDVMNLQHHLYEFLQEAIVMLVFRDPQVILELAFPQAQIYSD